MKNLITLLGFVVVLLAGCKEPKPVVKTFSTTISGFQYILHVDKPGEVAKSGDRVYYHVAHRNGSITTFDSRRQGSKPNSMFLPDFTNGAVKPTGLLDVMRHMSAGDSATVRMDLSKLPMKPRGYEYSNYMDYDVKMVRVETGQDALLHKIQQQVKVMDAEITPLRVDTEGGVTDEDPSLSSDQRDEMWNRSIVEQMRSVMRTVTGEYRAGTLNQKNRLTTLPSGLKILHVQKGTGNTVKSDDNVSIKYIGTTIEGKLFDSNFKRTQNFDFALGKNEVIPGLEEGVKQMALGGKAIIFVPANLAFGAKGRKDVQPNSEVAYLVTLHDIK